jgi:hypothetical protein
VLALLQDAQNINEYAFALGVLCHYNADKYGHSIGINPGVPMTYPKVEKKFGDYSYICRRSCRTCTDGIFL